MIGQKRGAKVLAAGRIPARSRVDVPECNDCCLPLDRCVCEDELTLTEPLAVDVFGLSVRGVMARARGAA